MTIEITQINCFSTVNVLPGS